MRLLVLVGPTACGKTSFGVDVAHELGTEIVSADSRQVYRGLDIGSGKDLEEYRRVQPPVRCHLIDIADPQRPYSVFEYQRDCYRVLASREPDAAPLLMVGGTGLYVEAVLSGYRIANVPEDVELRERLTRSDREELVRELDHVAPELSANTDHASKKRVVRALEIVHHARNHEVRYSDPPPVPVEHAVFAIRIPRDELHRRIDARLDARMGQGLIAEVQGLLDAGVTTARMAQLGLEYREVTAHLIGEKTEPQMIDDLRLGIRRLAKRQHTWFRGLPRRGIELTWIDPDEQAALLDHRWSG